MAREMVYIWNHTKWTIKVCFKVPLGIPLKATTRFLFR